MKQALCYKPKGRGFESLQAERVSPRGLVRLEGLGKLRKFIQLVGSRGFENLQAE
jgi:hypothetical protein